MSFFEYFDAGYAIIIALLSLLTALQVVARWTETDKDDKALKRIVDTLRKLVNVLSKIKR